MMGDTFPGRLGLQQRVLPSYRAGFLDAIAKACQGGLSVFAGKPLSNEGIATVDRLQIAQYVQAENRYFRDPSSPMFLCWQGGFLRWLEAWQPDVLIAEANPRYPATRMAILWMHHKGRKVIGWGLGAPPMRGPFSGLRTWERLSLLHSLDAIVAYSKQGAEKYRKLGLPPERVYVAPNAVAPAPSFPLPQRALQFNGRATVLFIGRLQPRKRVDLLIQACSSLPLELQPRLMVVGDGPARDELYDLAQRIYPYVEFIGAKHGAELEPYFTKADLFVLPGTGGLAIQQAMAHGLPVVVAQGDGTQDDLVRSENGWQVQPDDLLSLSNILQQALSDPVKLRQMGEASYRIVAEEINVEKMVEVFVQALNDLRKREL
jgi:glycosyltransferase involved in cell wall biosynthesis